MFYHFCAENASSPFTYGHPGQCARAQARRSISGNCALARLADQPDRERTDSKPSPRLRPLTPSRVTVLHRTTTAKPRGLGWAELGTMYYYISSSKGQIPRPRDGG